MITNEKDGDMEFEEGKDYLVYKGGVKIGSVIGDEFIRTLDNELVYRIDGEEIYTAGSNAEFIGNMSGLTGIDLSNQEIFTLELH